MGFGQRVREIRKKLGLSLNDLEQRTGVNKGYLSQLENEHQRNPSVHIAKRIAEALGLGLDDLLDAASSTATADEGQSLPPALAEYVSLRAKQGRPLPPRTIVDLQRIQYRGQYPQQPEQYEILVNQLEMFTHEPGEPES